MAAVRDRAYFRAARSAAAAVGGASKSAAIPFDVAEDILGHIRALKDQQLELKNARKIVTKQLRNQSKRMARIRKKARLLSDRDLLALLKMCIFLKFKNLHYG